MLNRSSILAVFLILEGKISVFYHWIWCLLWLFHTWLLLCHWSKQVTQTAKNLPAMQETWVWSLGWEDPLEKGMASHSSILAWRIPWTEEPGGLESMGLQRVRHIYVTFTFFYCFGVVSFYSKFVECFHHEKMLNISLSFVQVSYITAF